jgi:membrane-associated HD superfamily phosphohydrolase
MENWRRYVNEVEEEQQCRTVGSLMDTIDDLQIGEEDAENRAKLKGWGYELVKSIVGFIPIIGDSVSAGLSIYDTLKKAKNDLKTKEVAYDQVSDYPILAHLKIDPELVKVVEDDILKQLDEMYEEQILSKLSRDTCIDKIPSINEFIRGKIAIDTKKSVVIRDESET